MNESDLLVVRRVVLQPHRHLAGQADRAGRLRRLALGKFHPVTGCPVWGEIGVHRRARSPSGATAAGPTRVDQRPEVAERWAIWRAEKASRAADDRGRGLNSAAVFAALQRHVARRR